MPSMTGNEVAVVVVIGVFAVLLVRQLIWGKKPVAPAAPEASGGSASEGTTKTGPKSVT